LVEVARGAISKGKWFKLNAKAQEFLIRFRLKDDGIAVELWVEKVCKRDLIVPVGVHEA